MKPSEWARRKAAGVHTCDWAGCDKEVTGSPVLVGSGKKQQFCKSHKVTYKSGTVKLR